MNHFNEGNKLYTEKQFQKAIDSYKLSIASNSNVPCSYYNIGVCYIKLRDFDSAIKMIKKSLEFQKMLEKRTGLPVVMWDERLTTVEAHRTMMESGVRREDRKKYVDKLAAVYILQGYLDHEGMKRERTQPE